MKSFLPVSSMVAALGLICAPHIQASTILGIGTGALLGGDLTDPENDADPESDVGYNAVFTSSEEPGFGGGEFAFNVFDNQAGGGNSKWCCGDGNNFPANPISIDASFGMSHVLTHFTLTSGNDTPDRDPRVWEIQGSSDGMTWVTIFAQNDPSTSVWTERDQVVRFDAGIDFPLPAAYSSFRFTTSATNLTTGARFQLAEIEYFSAVPEPGTALLSLAALGLCASRRRRA